MDCNPGLVFTIPGFGIEDLLIAVGLLDFAENAGTVSALCTVICSPYML